MRKFIVALAALALTQSAFAVDKAGLNDQIENLTAKFVMMQGKPDKRIPADVLKKAKGIILLDRTKAGFIFAYQGGGGVALVREGNSQRWSAPAFFSANEASLGFQIGGQQSFVVILLLTTNATHQLTDSKIDFGGEARGTAGDSSEGVEGTASNGDQSVLVYTDREGLYGGAAIKGGAIGPNIKADITYYGKAVTTSDILFGKEVEPTKASIQLAKKINEFSKK